jgi:hypothetical protein
MMELPHCYSFNNILNKRYLWDSLTEVYFNYIFSWQRKSICLLSMFLILLQFNTNLEFSYFFYGRHYDSYSVV